jgi:hypothetical protein
LISKAIPHCDSSYTIASTAKFYTAWNSISALVEKDLVIKYGRPERFSLTETGFALAKRIKKELVNVPDAPASEGFKGKGMFDEDSESDLEIIDVPPVFAVPRAVNKPVASASGAPYTYKAPVASSSKASTAFTPIDAVFGYEYVDEDGKPSKNKNKALIEFDVEGVLYKITYHMSQARHVKAGRVMNAEMAGADGRIVGWFSDVDAADSAPGINMVEKMETRETPRKEVRKESRGFVQASPKYVVVESPKYVMPESPKGDYKPIVSGSFNLPEGLAGWDL